MTFQEFVPFSMNNFNGLRHGQNLMNALSEVRPELLKRLMEETALDCFYSDATLGEALVWIAENW